MLHVKFATLSWRGVAILSLLVSWAALARERSKKPVAYIHIGHGKVASTSIQVYLCSHSQLLAEEHNLAFLMPEKCWTSHYCRDYGAAFSRVINSCKSCSPIPNDAMEVGWGGRVPLCHADSAGAVPEVRQAAADALKLGRDVMFSSEYFSNWTPSGVAYLQDVLRGFELRILLLVRHPLSWEISLFAQGWGKHRTRELISRVVENAHESQGQAGGYMNRTIDRLVHPLSEFVRALGPDKVFVGSLEGMLGAGVSPETAVLQSFFGVDTSALEQPGHAHNPSPSPFHMEMHDFLHNFAEQKGEKLSLPRSGGARRDELEEDFKRLAGVMGEDIWTCHDYQDDFVLSEQEFMRALKETGATTFFLDGDPSTGGGYYHMQPTEVCRGSLQALTEDKSKSAELLEELRKTAEKWKRGHRRR